MRLPGGPRSGRQSGGAGAARLRLAAFLLLTAAVGVLGSERIYWFWAGFDPSANLALLAFYLLPASVAVWMLAWFRAGGIHQVVLAGTAYALITEGVLTPVLYEDGPLPLLASMFAGWHGIVTFTGLWYLTHRWLVERRVRRLALAGLGLGLWWGIWARASSVAEPPSSADIAGMNLDPTLLAPVEFALYALLTGSLLAVAHLLLSRVIPAGWTPTRRSLLLLAAVTGLFFAVAILPAIPWAPVKLAALLGLVWAGMSWTPPSGVGFTAIDWMAGQLRLRDVALLMVIPVAAASSYSLFWQVNSEEWLTSLNWAMVAAQAAVGAGAVLIAMRQAWRNRKSAAPLKGPQTPPRSG